MADITVVQGDTAPDVIAVIREEGGGPIDLTDCTVHFQMRKPDDKRYAVNAVAAIEDAAAGRVRYEWGANDLGVSGEYQAQFEVTFQGGKIQTTKTPTVIVVRRQ